MTYRRLYTIPDVHGRIDLLDHALELADKDGLDSKQDLIVFLGDYIDRGPNSREVVDLVQKLVESGEAKAVSGNHESFAIDYYTGKGDFYLWQMNGGGKTIMSYTSPEHWKSGRFGMMSPKHVGFLGSLPRYLEIQGFFFSHAPVPREKVRRADLRGLPYNLHELTWTYFGPECEMDQGAMYHHEGPLSQADLKTHLIGVCGHIHRGPSVREVRVFPQYRMLDVGCGCFPEGSLAVHECVSGRTLYARPGDLSKTGEGAA